MQGEPMSDICRRIRGPTRSSMITSTPPIGAHALRAIAATNALDHQADIAKVQEWLGHANIATTRIYITARRGLRTARRSRLHFEGIT